MTKVVLPDDNARNKPVIVFVYMLPEVQIWRVQTLYVRVWCTIPAIIVESLIVTKVKI